MTEEKDDRAEMQALSQLASIREMVAALKEAQDSEDEEAFEQAEQTIYEDPLSVQVRSDWVSPGTEKFEAAEFNILLCTGGPAVRIVGDLDEHGTPYKPRIEYQDWFEPWRELNFYYHYRDENDLTGKAELATKSEEALQAYCERFFYGC